MAAKREGWDWRSMDPANKVESFRRLSEEATMEFREAAKAGGADRFSMSRNFLATDKVPETIFGIPVVADDGSWTPEDLEFFREHPEAGGYYDMGEGTPEDGTEEGEPVQDDEPRTYGADYLRAFEQKRKEMVKATAERQYLALQKFRDPNHYKSTLKALNSALDRDARDAALLDEYDRLAEGNRPKAGTKRYDELIEQGRARYAGGAWERTMASLVSPDWTPPAVQSAAPAGKSGQSFADRAKEALDVVKALPEVIGSGARRAAADVKETLGAANAVLYAPKVPEGHPVEMLDPVSGTVRDGRTGRSVRKATAKDLTDIHEVNQATGYDKAYRQNAKGGESAQAADGAGIPGAPPPPAPASAPAEDPWARAQRAAALRRQAILDGRIEPSQREILLMSPADLRRAEAARRELMRRELQTTGWRTGRRMVGKGGKTDPEMRFMERNPTLFSHVKSFEKLRLEPYKDVGGYAIGYGAHTDVDGSPVTAETAAIDEATADRLLARDLHARRERLARSIPKWDRIPAGARQALLDVSMGKDGILSAGKSEGLHADLAAAGDDSAKLLAAVKKHYYSYLTKDPEHREGLMARRVAGGRTFFGEDFSYEGKVWDPARGFVPDEKTSAPSLPAGTDNHTASGGSTQSHGKRK